MEYHRCLNICQGQKNMNLKHDIFISWRNLFSRRYHRNLGQGEFYFFAHDSLCIFKTV